MNQFDTYIEFPELLKNALENNPKVNLDLITKAFEYAKEKHGSQMRKTGHPYYVHPLAVANIVAKLNLDEASIVAALLHDTIEDTDATIEEITELFGAEVADIVNGVTKLGEIKYKTDEIQQAENLRKLFLALSKDIRVLIVKLCDRLHNMMTMDGIKSQKKRRAKAIESLEIYAPLAQRIGMYQVKDLLEELSFEVINSRARGVVLKRINEIKSNTGEEELANEDEKIRQKLLENGINAEIKFRYKSPYSIWKKMQNKEIVFDKIFDILGYRIITETEQECYITLSIIHSVYRFIPNSFMDYISNQKQNGYRSLHTSVINKNGLVIEFQIRTKQMQNEAEFGLASHWMYKSGEKDLSSLEFKNKWISQILQILNSKSSATEILEYAKLEMTQNKVFVFTESGDVKHFPVGSSLIDFAFSISEDLGKYFHGANVNNIFTQDPKTELKNGDRISIITAKNQTISESWLGFVKTGVAKLAIKNALKNLQNYEISAKGLNILKQACKARGVLFNQNLIQLMLNHENENDIGNFYVKIFHGKINPIKIIDKLFNAEKKTIKKNESIKQFKKQDRLQPITLSEIPNLRCFLAKCCSGISFPRSLKIHLNPSGAFVHDKDCKILTRIMSEENIIKIYSDIQNNSQKTFAKISIQDNDFDEKEVFNICKKFDVNLDKIVKKNQNDSMVKEFYISSCISENISKLFYILSEKNSEFFLEIYNEKNEV